MQYSKHTETAAIRGAPLRIPQMPAVLGTHVAVDGVDLPPEQSGAKI